MNIFNKKFLISYNRPNPTIFIISGKVNSGKTLLIESFLNLINSKTDFINPLLKNKNTVKNLKSFLNFLINSQLIEYWINTNKIPITKNKPFTEQKNNSFQPQIDGFLCKKVFFGNTHIGYNLIHIQNGNIYPLGFKYTHFPDNLEIKYKISKYRFSKIGIDKGNKIIINSILKGIKNIIIDEVGFLELFQQGFYNGFKFALNSDVNLFLVIRDFLVKTIIKHFKIKKTYIFYLK